MGSLFIAIALHLLPDRLKDLLDVPTRIAASLWASEPAVAGGAGAGPPASQLAVVKIDAERFLSRYEGNSPLPRAALMADLASLLNANRGLKWVAIDLDLSPTISEIHATSQGEPYRCDLPMDEFIVKNKARMLLIAPVNADWIGIHHGPVEAGVRLALDAWLACMAGKGVQFAHANVLVESAAWPPQLLPQINYLLLGAGYSADDEFLTPIGELNGVDIHAAIAAQPNETEQLGSEFIFDIAIGVVLACVIHGLWRRYFGQATATTARQFEEHGQPRLAYRWLVALAGAVGLLLAIVLWASAALFAWFGLWLSPAAMAIGVMLEAFVTGGVHEALHAISMDNAAAKADPPVPAASGPEPLPATGDHAYWALRRCWCFDAAFHLPSIVWLLVVGGHVAQILLHWLAQIVPGLYAA